MFVKKAKDELIALLDEEDALPSEKRAAVNLIELRTKLEVRTQILKLVTAYATALTMALVLSKII